MDLFTTNKDMTVRDISFADLSDKLYGGSESKVGIVVDGKYYIMKYPKQISNVGKTLSHVSENLASRIIKIFGVPVHNTELCIYKNQEVVILEDFAVKGRLLEFNTSSESLYDTDLSKHRVYTYAEILCLIRKHSKLVDIASTIERFWKQFVLDALLANFDRHGYNWGFLIQNNEYSLAPIYDNGSSLFPRLVSDEDCIHVLSNKAELDRRTFEFPTSQIMLHGKKSLYYSVLKSKEFEGCTQAMKWLIEQYDAAAIQYEINRTPFISETHKEFYSKIIDYRFNKLFKEII